MPETALALAVSSAAAVLLSGRALMDVDRGGGYHRGPPPGHHHGDGHHRGDSYRRR